MNTKRFFALVAMLCVLGISKQAIASHSMGADISYQCLGGDTVVVSLNFYRDCDGITAPSSASVRLSSASCGVTSLTFSLPLAGTSEEVSALCPASLPQSTCNGGALPGVEQYLYRDTIIMPAQCSDWIVSYSLCCRNGLITTLTNPESFDIYVEARLNNAGGICNNSPMFTSLPVPYVCAGQQFSYNHGAVDIDGDSLVYSLVCPLDGPNACVTYAGGFSPQNFISTTPPNSIQFDPSTGQITFTPSVPQVGVAAVLVQEYRNGVLIGSTMRDIQVVVITCNNNQPVVSGIQNQTGGATRDSVTVEVCPGETITFQVNATDPDGTNNITMIPNDGIPGATFTVTGTGNNVTGNFSWTPLPADSGLNVITVTVNDGACPIFGTSVVSFQIYVLNGTTAGADQYYCPAGGAVQLSAAGGNTFTWTPADSLSNPNIRNPLAFPSVTTEYVVTSDLSGQCKNTDTVVVFVVPDFTLTMSDQDSICRNGSTVISATPDASGAPYTFQWTPPASLLEPNAGSTTAFPEVTTTYRVAVRSNQGCLVRDSVTVVVNGIGPIVEITADRNNVCPGDSVQLTGQIFPLECGPTLLGCSAQNLPIPKPYATGTVATFAGTPFGGSNEDVRYQALYLASEMLAAGIGPGTITRIELEVGSKASTGVYQNFTMKMGCTANTSLSSDQWEPANTIVFGPAIFSTSNGSNSFPLSVPFDWDGRTNLVLEICFNNPALASAGGNDQLLSFTPATNYNASMRATANNTSGCTLNPMVVYTQIPKTTFHICDPSVTNYIFSWTPTTGLSASNVLSPKVAVQGVTQYTLFVQDSLCEGSGYIIVNVDTNYSITVSPDTTLCGGGQVQLNVSVLGDPPKTVLPCGVNGTLCSNPANVLQVGAGTQSTGNGTPYEGAWEDGRVQYLFTASELLAAGFTSSGTITSMAFNVTQKGSTIPYQSYTIKMSCTGLPSLPGSTFVAAPFSVVYGPVSYNTSVGWNTHVFTNPYDWDGLSNIIVEICFDNVNFLGDDDVQYSPTPGFTSVVYDFTDGAIGCNLNTPLSTSNRANVRFGFCTAPTGTASVLWRPNNTLSDSTSASPIASPTTTTTYTVDYTFVNGCVHTDSVTVGFIQFNTTISPDVSICQGESTQLIVAGGVSYEWDSLPGLSCYNCPDPVATPDSTTKYYVSITNALGTCIKRDSVTVTIFPKPFIKFSNDSMYCFVGSIVLDAGAGFVSYNWNPPAQTQTITVTTAGLYSVTVTDNNGCENSDTILLTLNPPPTVDLGPDITGCLGDSVTLDAGAGFVTYAWTNASTSEAITVGTPGVYAVTVTDANSCPGIDTAVVTFNSPSVNLGSDATLCAGVSLILIAGDSSNTYQWNVNGSTDTFLIVSQPGIYSVTATDATNCIAVDSVTFNYFPDNSIDLGPDTVTCNNRSVTFNAGAGYNGYEWSTGAVSQAITTSTPGTYWVSASDVNNCVYRDTVLLNDITPSVDIGGDRSICQGETAVFDAGPGFTAYNWSNNGTTDTIAVNLPNVYSVTVTGANACTASDNARLTVNPLPMPNLGAASDSVCPDHILYPGPFETYEWTGSSTDSILIVDFTGNYCVTVTDINGCENTACVDLLVYELNLSVSDVLLCDDGDSATLSAPAGLASYRWSTSANDTLPDVTVTAPGTYSVTVTNAQGCVGTDDGIVSFDSMSVVASADSAFVGSGGTATLNADVVNGSGAYSFNWTPAETLDNPNAQNPEASPEGNTIYAVEVTDEETGCTATDTVEIIVDSRFTFPDAFTPNGDGQNERFGAIQTGSIIIKEFRIYNRWGQLVSEDVNGWDGNFNGKEQPVGTYSYSIVAQLANGDVKTQSGVFSLLR